MAHLCKAQRSVIIGARASSARDSIVLVVLPIRIQMFFQHLLRFNKATKFDVEFVTP